MISKKSSFVRLATLAAVFATSVLVSTAPASAATVPPVKVELDGVSTASTAPARKGEYVLSIVDVKGEVNPSVVRPSDAQEDAGLMACSALYEDTVNYGVITPTLNAGDSVILWKRGQIVRVSYNPAAGMTDTVYFNTSGFEAARTFVDDSVQCPHDIAVDWTNRWAKANPKWKLSVYEITDPAIGLVKSK